MVFHNHAHLAHGSKRSLASPLPCPYFTIFIQCRAATHNPRTPPSAHRFPLFLEQESYPSITIPEHFIIWIVGKRTICKFYQAQYSFTNVTIARFPIIRIRFCITKACGGVYKNRASIFYVHPIDDTYALFTKESTEYPTIVVCHIQPSLCCASKCICATNNGMPFSQFNHSTVFPFYSDVIAHFRFLSCSRMAGCCSFADGTRRRCSLESALPAMPETLAFATRGTSPSLPSPAPADSPHHRRRSDSEGVTLQTTHGSRLYPHAYGNQSPRTRIVYHIPALCGKSAAHPIQSASTALPPHPHTPTSRQKCANAYFTMVPRGLTPTGSFLAAKSHASNFCSNL